MGAAIHDEDVTDTSIRVSKELADELYVRKGQGTSYEEYLWELLDRVDELEGEAEESDSGAASRSNRAAAETRAEPEPEPEQQSFDEIVDEIANQVLPGSGAKLESRREALHAAVDYLREQGVATPSDLKENVYPEHKAQYTQAKDPARSWWKNCIYKGFSELAERTEEVENPDASGQWTWTGDR